MWTVIDKLNNRLVSSNFENIFVCNWPEASAKVDRKWGLFDAKANEWVFEPRFDELRCFQEHDTTTAACIDDLFGLADRTGRFVLEPAFDIIREFCDGVAAACVAGQPRFSGRRGYLTPEGEWSIPPKYQNAHDFSEERAVVQLGRFEFRYIDLDGQFVGDQHFTQASPLSEGMAYVQSESVNGYIDRNGELVLKTEWAANAFRFFGGLAMYVPRGLGEDRYGYIDLHGEPAFDHLFDDASSFSDGIAQVEVAGKWGAINTSGEFVVEPKYDSIGAHVDGLIPARFNGKAGFLDLEGRVAIPFEYDRARSFVAGQGVAIVKTFDR